MYYHRCPQCNILFYILKIKFNQIACCPRCKFIILDNCNWSLSQLGMISISILFLMPLAWIEPLFRIYVFDVHVDVNLLQGIWKIANQGDLFTAFIILFCTIFAPLFFFASIFYLWIGNIFRINIRRLLLILDKIKKWIMLDIYLAGLAIALFKANNYLLLKPGIGLPSFILLVLLSVLATKHLDFNNLWERFYPKKHMTHPDKKLMVCLNCYFTSYPDTSKRCPRCYTAVYFRQSNSLQKCFAFLVSSLFLMLPANFLPISILYIKGIKQEDTIISGIISLVNSNNIAIAVVVFITGIFIPFTKIIILFYLLVSSFFKTKLTPLINTLLLRFLNLISHWSMLDLFVISLTFLLINNNQFIFFQIGPAVFYFSSSVFLTILAVEYLDSRLLWDTHEPFNAIFSS